MQGLEVSLRCILQDCIVQRQISYQLLQPIVLLLKHLQSLSLLGTDPTVLPTLAVVRVIRDRQFLGYLANRPTLRNQNLSLPQLVDDLLWCFLQDRIPQKGMRTFSWTELCCRF